MNKRKAKKAAKTFWLRGRITFPYAIDEYDADSSVWACFLRPCDERVTREIMRLATMESWWNACHWDSPLAIRHSYDVESEDDPYAVETVVGYAAKCLKPRIRRRYA